MEALNLICGQNGVYIITMYKYNDITVVYIMSVI